jgi:hypothetical protein
MAALWVFAMAAIATFLLSTTVLGRINDIEDEVASNRETLDLIALKQRDFVAGQSSGKGEDVKLKIKDNKLKLTTFLDKEAGRFDLKIDSFKESSAALGSKRAKKAKKGGIIEESVTIEIGKAEYGNIMKFLDAVDGSRELMVIKRVQIKKPRRAKDQEFMEATITVSTFKEQTS